MQAVLGWLIEKVNAKEEQTGPTTEEFNALKAEVTNMASVRAEVDQAVGKIDALTKTQVSLC